MFQVNGKGFSAMYRAVEAGSPSSKQIPPQTPIQTVQSLVSRSNNITKAT